MKDRNFQRELMERSNSVGMLGALLGARHSGAGRAPSTACPRHTSP
ncbi:MAG: hypothetical protein AB1511_04665 [Deinococcota bacterium]